MISKDKLNNYGLWTSLFSLIGLILVDMYHIDLGHYQEYVQLLLVILSALGIVSDPSSGKWYKDKK